MVELPKKKKDTAAAIYRHYEENNGDWRRPHLGASVIGHSCSRHLWYTFRWAAKRSFDGRMLRLFERGNREENWVAEDLRAIGVKLQEVDPSTITEDNPDGDQWHFEALGGHYAGSCDGMGTGFPEAPVAVHVVEYKTSNTKWFKKIKKEGVKKAKPEHYAQMQTYMGFFIELGYKTKRAIYILVCKETDEIYIERIQFDKEKADTYTRRAELVIKADEPLSKVSEIPTWHACQFCDHHDICQMEKVEDLERNCRTCASSTAESDGTWSCVYHKKTLSLDDQKAGCPSHLFIPKLLPWDAIDYDETGRMVSYRDHGGQLIIDADNKLTMGGPK